MPRIGCSLSGTAGDPIIDSLERLLCWVVYLLYTCSSLPSYFQKDHPNKLDKLSLSFPMAFSESTIAFIIFSQEPFTMVRNFDLWEGSVPLIMHPLN